MGTFIGHVAPGFGFLLLGLWHLYNHTKLHTLDPRAYRSLPWFPSPILRHLEPVLIIVAMSTSIAVELFVAPASHQPLDRDWTIPTNHLHNFEHSSMYLAFLVYGLFVVAFDKLRVRDREVKHGLTQLVGAAAFVQQLLVFHLHSSDHMGVEGQYHWLLQLVLAALIGSTIVGIWKDRSFLVSFVRSFGIALQGVWFIVTGYALWTPGLIPKGCFMNLEDGHRVVRCRDRGSLERAKSLANIEFSWVLVGMVVFTVAFYLVLSARFPARGEYVALDPAEEDEDLEARRFKKKDEEAGSLDVPAGPPGFKALELER